MTPPVRPVSEVTSLSPVEEQQFRAWATANGITDVDHPDAHYDYRGFWKETGGKPVRYGVDHFPDTYKQHGHPTFSVESRYSAGPNDGGHWNGEEYVSGAPAPTNRPDPRILANLQRLKDAGAPDEALEAYLAEENAKPASSSQRQLHARDVARRMTSANEMDAAQLPDYKTQVLGGIASLVKDIPGGEAVQALMRSAPMDPNATAAMARHPIRTPDQPQSYPQALSDIRGAEADAPASVRTVNRLAGGVVAGSVVPGSPMLAGARYGIAHGLLGADPDQTVKDRLHSAAKEGAVGAVAGKAGDVGLTWLRGFFSPSLGKQALARSAAMKAADEVNYGRATAEGAGQHGPLSPALAAPDIKPYVDAVRSSRQFANADEPTLLREAYKLMSERQGKLGQTIANAGDYKAGTSLEKRDIGLAKQQLLDAADQIMPSFRPATEQHAEMASNREAFRRGADMAQRIIRGTAIAGKKLEQNSAEAFAESIAKMKEEAAHAAIDGLLGRLQENNRLSVNPLKLFGAGPSLSNASKLAPFLRALETRAGTNAGTAARAIRTAVTTGLLGQM